MRAFLDALAMKVEPFKSPYEPLLVKPPVKELLRQIVLLLLTKEKEEI